MIVAPRTDSVTALSERPLPPALPGYEHIRRYRDATRDVFAAKLLPGEFYVTASGEMLTTVLGSCISVCVRDVESGIGGMNHFMLPHSDAVDEWGGPTAAARYGSHAMEMLINAVMKAGGRRERLEYKAFGGGNIVSQPSSVGTKNIEFLHEFVRLEGIRLTASDLGGQHPRKVVFFPETGRAGVKKLRMLNNQTIVQRERRYSTQLDERPVRGEVELF